MLYQDSYSIGVPQKFNVTFEGHFQMLASIKHSFCMLILRLMYYFCKSF